MKPDRQKYYQLIGKLNVAVSKADSYDDAVQTGLHLILQYSAADYAVVWRKDGTGETLRPFYWICPIDLTAAKCDVGNGIVGRAYLEKKAEVISDFTKTTDEETARDFAGMKYSSAVCVPFSDESSELGCLEFFKETGTFSEEDTDAFEILTMLTEIALRDEAPANHTGWEKNVLMTVRGLTKTYHNGEIDTPVLFGVNFDIFDGEFVCFLGESGCGKSTVLNIIGGMDTADEGTVTFLGKEITAATDAELTAFRRDNIGFIFQSYNLMPNLTAKENLDLIGELVENPMNSEEALKIVNLEDRMYNYPAQLSGGQQQRVSIARALVKRPKMIFADEPTAALDYKTSIEVLSALEEVIHGGTTVLMVTHNEEITKMADRVIRFRNGKTYEVIVNRHPKKATELVW